MAGEVGPALRVGMPLAVVLLVVAGDLLSGDNIVYGLLCAVPLLVAQVDGPRQVVGWGALCVAVELLLGVVDQAYVDADALRAQAIRVGFTVFATAAGAALSSRRLRTEARLRRMTAVAATAQRAVLRPLPERVGPWGVAVDYTGAYAESRVGGDLYDAQLTEHGLLVLVGDTRGKGLEAVRLAALVLGTFRHPSSRTADPALVQAALHATVEQHAGSEDFVTAVLVELTAQGRCRIWNAGHPPPLLLRAGRAVELATSPPAPPLGLGVSTDTPADCWLQQDDVVVLFTDGLSEARRPADRAFFDVAGAAAVLVRPDRLADGVVALRDAAAAWTGEALHDDVAIVAVRQP